MSGRLRVTSAAGERTTVRAMLRGAPGRINVAWSAQGVLFNVGPEDAVNLVHDLERELRPHGFTHVEARVYSPPLVRARAGVGAKPTLSMASAPKEPGVCLWGLVIGAITRLW